MGILPHQAEPSDQRIQAAAKGPEPSSLGCRHTEERRANKGFHIGDAATKN